MSDKPTPESYGFDETRIPDIEREVKRRREVEVNKSGVAEVGAGIGCFIVAFSPVGLIALHYDEPCVIIPFAVFAGVLLCFHFISEKEKSTELAKLQSVTYANDGDVQSYNNYLKGISQWEAKQKVRWEKMDGHKFERQFAILLNKNGWKTIVTKGSGDHGVDLKGTSPDGEIFLIQCKWWKKPCGEAPVRDLAGVLSVEGGKGLLVCKAGFTSPAKEWAKKADVQLWDIKDVMRLVEKTEF